MRGTGAMRYGIHTHDAWGVVPVGEFASLEEARQVLEAMRQDPWYRSDGTVRGLELVAHTPDGERQRLEWVAFSAD